MANIDVPRKSILYMCDAAGKFFRDFPGEDITFQKDHILLLESVGSNVAQWLYDELAALSEEPNSDELRGAYLMYRNMPDPVQAQRYHEALAARVAFGDGWYNEDELDYLWTAFTWLGEHV